MLQVYIKYLEQRHKKIPGKFPGINESSLKSLTSYKMPQKH